MNTTTKLLRRFMLMVETLPVAGTAAAAQSQSLRALAGELRQALSRCEERGLSLMPTLQWIVRNIDDLIGQHQPETALLNLAAQARTLRTRLGVAAPQIEGELVPFEPTGEEWATEVPAEKCVEQLKFLGTRDSYVGDVIGGHAQVPDDLRIAEGCVSLLGRRWLGDDRAEKLCAALPESVREALVRKPLDTGSAGDLNRLVVLARLRPEQARRRLAEADPAVAEFLATLAEAA